MTYLTIGDSYSGVYLSQVIDVCKHLSHLAGRPIPLIAFISPRIFFEQRRKIKAAYKEAWVLPAWPGSKHWRRNYALLWLLMIWLKPEKIMARGILATQMALKLRKQGRVKKVIFDGRGAYHAEWNEYEVIPDEQLVQAAWELERQSVLEADFRLAVSKSLVEYWRENFDYPAQKAYVVVPCTLGKGFQQEFPVEERLNSLRQQYGFQPNDLVLVYAGSVAGWQSFAKVDVLLLGMLDANPSVKVLFLSRIDLDALAIYRQFPDRVTKDWVSPQQVFEIMCAGDYGLLIREPTVTNQVAAPTKYAEYLACGLKILISPQVGDYSTFTHMYHAGYVLEEPVDKINWDSLSRPNYTEKLNQVALAREYFRKESFSSAWKQILNY